MSNLSKTSLINISTLKQILRNDYKNTYVLDLESFFRNFTTYVNATGVAHYLTPPVSTGIIGVDQLNPFGWSTIFNGLPWGNEIPADYEGYDVTVRTRATGIRSMGIKTPQTYVGWGYDLFGFPAPNYNDDWNNNGVYGTGTAQPSYYFRGADDTQQYPFVGHGSDVDPKKWLAGPMDLRWDQHRKVWTGHTSVYAGEITKVIIAGGGDPNQPQFYNDISYNVMMYDGLGSGIHVTGVRPTTYHPPNNNYKFYAVPTGYPCFILHQKINGRPGFGIYLLEPPYTTNCDNNDPQQIDSSSSSVVSSAQEGGTGHATYNQYDMLLGGDDLALDRVNLQAGSGITFDFSEDGIFKILIDPSVNFTISSGVNYNITALSGLLQPLSIGQGGTGSSFKNFVDLSTNQSISGIKNFTQNIRIANGSSNNPSLGFNYQPTYGLFFGNNALHLAASGSDTVSIYPTGTVFNNTISIRPSGGYDVSLSVRQRNIIGANLLVGSGLGSYSSNIQEWQTASGSMLSNIDSSGWYNGYGIGLYNPNYSAKINIRATGSLVNSYDIVLPTGGYLPFSRNTVNSSGKVFFGTDIFNIGEFRNITPRDLGSNPDATKVLYGDGTWQVPAGGSSGSLPTGIMYLNDYQIVSGIKLFHNGILQVGDEITGAHTFYSNAASNHSISLPDLGGTLLIPSNSTTNTSYALFSDGTAHSANFRAITLADISDNNRIATTGISILAGTGLIGGGDLSSTRTLHVNWGTGINLVPQGNDARFYDSRNPTLHASTHQHNGSDEIATSIAAANAIPKANSDGNLAINWIPSNIRKRSMFVCIGNGIDIISTGTITAGIASMPVSGVINQYTILGKPSGSISVDVLKGTYAGFSSTSSITSTSPIIITSGIKNTNNNLSTWTTGFIVGDNFEFNVLSCSGFKEVKIAIDMELL